LQAIQDALSYSTGRRSAALRWMTCKDQEAFSFSFICRVVNRDPEDVRRFCQRRATARTVLPFRFPLDAELTSFNPLAAA